MSIEPLLKKLPGSQRTKVFVGTVFFMALAAIPVFGKDEKQGHDLFSQEKPEAVSASIETKRKQYLEALQKQRIEKRKQEQAEELLRLQQQQQQQERFKK